MLGTTRSMQCTKNDGRMCWGSGNVPSSPHVEVCYAFKTQLANRSISMEQKLGCLEAYRQHLHDTFCDRTMIWSMQAESADFNSSILVIATDGLDQSKFALPREPEMRINSGLTFRSNGMIFQMFCNTLKILLVNLVLDLPAQRR